MRIFPEGAKATFDLEELDDIITGAVQGALCEYGLFHTTTWNGTEIRNNFNKAAYTIIDEIREYLKTKQDVG